MNLSRRELLLGSALPLLAQKSQVAGPRPNILLIVADDLASWMLGCYGNQEIRTPHIDTLARTGVRFRSNFVVTPVCSASRATLFTGRVPRQHGIHDFLTDQPIDTPPQGQKDVPAAFASEVMVSDLLAQGGYQCGYVGKWHMGNDTKPGHGYQYTCTINGGSSSYVDPTLYLNGEKSQESGYLAEILTRRAGDFLDRQAPGKPFFLTASYTNPHTPYDGHPARYYDMYAKTSFDTIGWERPAPNALREKEMLRDTVGNIRKCAASVTALDDQVAALIRKLHERKLWDNTLVIFTGDNGFLLGRHGLWSKGLASDPINMYEEVMQVPMIWSWPGQTPTQTTRPELVSYYDFMPSLCAAAGVTAPSRNLCGRSYLPLATGKPLPKKEPWRNLVFGHFRNTEMARDNRFKLVLRNEGRGPNEFFDLENDPGERVNHYQNGTYLQNIQRLERELATWRKNVV